MKLGSKIKLDVMTDIHILTMGQKLDKKPDYEILISRKEIEVICCALATSNNVLRKYITEEKKDDFPNRKDIKYIEAYIKFQNNLIKDFNNMVY